MPLSFSLTFAKILALLNFWIIKIRVDVVLKQLGEAFPEKSEKEIRKIAKEIFINFSKNSVEFCWFSSKSLKEKFKYFSFYEFENIKLALSYGKGLILMTGHLGNWEIVGQILSQYTDKIYAVVQKQKNPYFNSFVNKIRVNNKVHLIPKKFAFRGIVKAVKDNNIIVILGDQNAGKQGIFVDFFGKQASTYSGAAKIALRFGCPIIFLVCIRQKNGKYSVYLGKPIFLKQKDSFDINVENYTQKFTSLLEKWIRQYPSQWFWLHKRWRTKKVRVKGRKKYKRWESDKKF